MNNSQKIVLGITIILIGCILLMFIVSTTDIMPPGFYYLPEFTIGSLFVVILGIVLIAGGLIVLFSIKKR